MRDFGVVLILIGLVTAATGAVILFFGGVPLLGRLPGDIVVRGRNYRFYFPIVTCILISILLTLILALISRFFSR